MALSAYDISKLQEGALAFEAARSKLLSADATTFLLALMSFIAVTLPVTVIFGVNRKIKRAGERIDQAHQISRGLASFIGASSASQWASTLASMIDRNLDRLASELTASTIPDQGDSVVGVMGDWLVNLRDTVHDRLPRAIELLLDHTNRPSPIFKIPFDGMRFRNLIAPRNETVQEPHN